MRAKIFVLGLILLLIPLSGTEKADVINYSWQELFTEPCEIAYIIMEDWTTFTYTSQLENEIYITIGKLGRQLRTSERNYKIKDIAIIIHNHLKDCKFSPTDYKQYRRFKKYGFKGHFLLYSHTTNKTYDIEGGNR